MGLDVGVVQVDYLARPDGSAYHFLWHLNENADEADWNGSSAENTFVQYTRETLWAQLHDYASGNDLSESERHGLRSWIDGLPWKDDLIMLHLTW